MDATTLERAIGLDAVHKLRDWLLYNFPRDAPDPAVNRSNVGWAVKPIRIKADDRFYVEAYSDRNGREWWRVMDRVTQDVALFGLLNGKVAAKQEMFVSHDEAFKRCVELIEMKRPYDNM